MKNNVQTKINELLSYLVLGAQFIHEDAVVQTEASEKYEINQDGDLEHSYNFKAVYQIKTFDEEYEITQELKIIESEGQYLIIDEEDESEWLTELELLKHLEIIKDSYHRRRFARIENHYIDYRELQKTNEDRYNEAVDHYQEQLMDVVAS